MRGNPEPKDDKERGLGSIPACAGEPNQEGLGRGYGRVYPRVCGGTGPADSCWGGKTGLSPRVRGNPGRHRAQIQRQRSIPACAGEPRCPPAPSIGERVYPRVCGGTITAIECPLGCQGLSPRVRGNQEQRDWILGSFRSIPACAGEPTRVGRPINAGPVYPRVCGGTTIRPSWTRSTRGLSPRVRGNLHRRHPGNAAQRSIPACAGEPPAGAWPWPNGTVYPRVCGGTLSQGLRLGV